MIRDEKGQSMVEFTLVIPILLFVLIGIFDIGRVTYVYSSLHFAAQETVRVGGLGELDDKIIARAHDSFNAGDPTKLNVEISPLPSERKSGEYLTVNLSYPIEPLTPLIGTLISNNLTVDSTIRIE